MGEFVKSGNGLLFKNFRKRQESHPDYIGTCTVNGVALEISAWLKDRRPPASGKFMSLSFSPPRPKNNTAGLPAADQAPGESQHQPDEPTAGDGFIV